MLISQSQKRYLKIGFLERLRNKWNSWFYFWEIMDNKVRWAICFFNIILKKYQTLRALIPLSQPHHRSPPVITLGRSSRWHSVTTDTWWILVFAGISMCRSPQENIAYEFVLASTAVSSMTYLSYLDSLWDGRLSGFVQNSTQDLCVVPIKLFLQALC